MLGICNILLKPKSFFFFFFPLGCQHFFGFYGIICNFLGKKGYSTVSIRSGSSLASLSDILHEEDEILHSDNDLQNWSIPKVDKKEVYKTSWVPAVFQPEHKVKTVERSYALNKNKEECLLFRKKEMKEFRNKGCVIIC